MKFQEAKFPLWMRDALEFKRKFNVSMDVAHKETTKLRKAKVYLSEKYQVVVSMADMPMGPMIHLSIKRRDKEPIHDWRDLQEIKNSLLGPEYEAVELYPAESRRVDAANQYHLWCTCEPDVRFPFGYVEREVGGPEEAMPYGAKQRPFEEEANEDE